MTVLAGAASQATLGAAVAWPRPSRLHTLCAKLQLQSPIIDSKKPKHRWKIINQTWKMMPSVWWIITSSRKRCPWLWMQWWSHAWLLVSWTFGCLWKIPTTHCPCSLSSRLYLSSWHLPRVWLQTSQSHLMSPVDAARMRKSNLPSLPMPLVRLLGASTHASCSLHSRSSGHKCHQSLCRLGA